MFHENLKTRFANTNTFSNHDINKFISLLQKGIQIYIPIRIYGWLGKFNETPLPEKEDFYNHLSMKDITNAD